MKPRSSKKRALEEIYLTEDEFFLFRKSIEGKFKSTFSDLVTVQYYVSLRISEAAAICYEDILWDWENPSSSRIVVRRYVYWPRKKGHPAEILDGFKNSKFLPGEIKVLPMYPEMFEVLSKRYKAGATGPIFTDADGGILEYRSLQNAYDRAFKRAQLPFTGTHIMRHGGASRVYNLSGGDLSLVMQQLGVTDQKTALVYAKRHKEALNDFSKKLWGNSTGKNSSK